MSVTESDIPEVFFTDGWLTAVEYLVSSGKEGTVFCCRAEPHTGHERLAVKIHRGRGQRSFKNDAIYLSGRAMGVSLSGSAGVKSSGMPDRRLERAVAKRSKRGKAAIEHSWINHEFNTLQLLHAAGAHVPQPFAMSGHAMLMAYVGDGNGPAPKLKHVSLTRQRAVELFTGLIDEIALWLACERIHGDLSPFNILYWNEQATVIDFPQAVNPRENPDSLYLLERDIRNVVTYFEAYGVAADPERIARDLWLRFMRGTL
jgi:RIO kinase 1